MNPNLLNYNYRPVNSQTIPVIPTSSPISTLSPSAAARLNPTHCLQTSDGSINSGMINEMQTSQSYLPFDDHTALLNLFIDPSDSCSTMAPNQMASNDLISDQNHQQLVGTTNDHPYSRVERESRTDHQLTPISNSVNYVSNSANLQLGRINSNPIGGNSQHHQTHHSHTPIHHHSPHQHQHPTHLQPFHQPHQRHQHSMSHHIIQPQPQPPHHSQPPPHQSIHNYVQQPNSNHQLFNSNYLTRPSNMVNHGSPEQCRGLGSPASSPNNCLRVLNADNSPRTLSENSGTSSLLAATNSYHTSSQSTNSSQSTISSQKSEDSSQKSQNMNSEDLDRNRFKEKPRPAVQTPRQPVEPTPQPPLFSANQPSKPKPEVIDVSPPRPREEKKEDKAKLSNTDSSDQNVEVELRSVSVLRTFYQVFYKGRILGETAVVDSQPMINSIGHVKTDLSVWEQKNPIQSSSFGPFSGLIFIPNNSGGSSSILLAPSSSTAIPPVSSDSSDSTLKQESKFSVKSSSSSNTTNVESRSNSASFKGGCAVPRKSVKHTSSKEPNQGVNNMVRESRSSTESKPLVTGSITESTTKNQSNSTKRKGSATSYRRAKKHRGHDADETTKKELDVEGVKKEKEITIKTEELIDSEETRRETATALLSLHSDSLLVRSKDATPDVIIDRIREPEFRPIEKDNQVFAKWARDKHFYPGKATSPQTDSKWMITFDDGEQRSVHESEIISVPYLVPGQHVMLTYPNESCQQRVIKRCFVKKGCDVEYEMENEELNGKRYPTRNIFLTSEMAAILLGKQSKFPSNASKFADVDLNNIIPTTCKRSRVSKTTSTSSVTTTNTTTTATSLTATVSSSIPSHTMSSDDHGSAGQDSDTGSVSSYKSTKSRSTSFSKQFLPSLSPSGKVPNETASKTKKGPTAKHPPPLPLYKKSNSDSSSSKSSSISSSSKISIVQGEKEKLLGPIPPEGSTFFEGIGFLLTDRHIDKSNKETVSSEAGSSIPFDSDYLITQIQNGAGKVFDDLDAAREAGMSEIVLIAYTYLKSSLYMQCLHAGIPCVMHTWVIECCREGQLLQKAKFLLPSGYSSIKSSLPSDKTVFKKSANLFKGLKILIADSKLVDKWKPVLSAGQTIIVSSLPTSTGSSTRKTANSVDLIVADNNCSTVIIKKAQQMNIPIVTSEYLEQCLINGKKFQHDFHDDFIYK